MAAIDLYNAAEAKGIDPVKQRALDVAWVLITSNTLWISPATRLVRTDKDLKKVEKDGAASSMPLYYIDMRSIYGALPELTPTEIDALFALAQHNNSFQSVANLYWGQGRAILDYPGHYCHAMKPVLELNKGAKLSPGSKLRG